MTKIYFIRHVQAMGNISRVFQGQIDTEVSKQGYVQIDNLKTHFENIYLDAVYTSPLNRAKLTAMAVLGDKDIPFIEKDDFKEIAAGVWEGVSLETIGANYPEELAVWQSRLWDFKVEGSESGREVYDRVGAGFEKIRDEIKGKEVAIISHGCALKFLICYVLGLKPEEIGKVGWLSNASVTKIVIDGDIATAEFFNDCEHIDKSTMLDKPNILK